MRTSPRTRRLTNDWKALQTLQLDTTILTVRSYGAPPEAYDLSFEGVGLKEDSGKVERQHQHHVEVRLGANYPCVMPELRWKTPIYHPNISASGAVCLGGYQTHWVPSLDLAELCDMLWDMIRYANYDVTSPYNRAAALWARTQSHFQFPLDQRPLRDKVAKRPREEASAEPEIILADVVEAKATDEATPTQDEDDVWFIG